MKKITINGKNISGIQNDLDQGKMRTEQVFRESARKSDFMTFVERFDKFSQIETIQVLEKDFLPKIENFSGLVDDLESSHETMRECIRKFDEDVTLMASKS